MKALSSAFNLLGVATGLCAALALVACDSGGPSSEPGLPADEGTGVVDKGAGSAKPPDPDAGLPGRDGESDQRRRFTRIWHEDSGVAIENVPTPDGFAISPEQAYYPLRETISRPSFLQWHLYVDATNYYIVVHRTDDEDTPAPNEILSTMPAHSRLIDGTTGERRTYPGE